jgi:hypothetical protein
VQLYPLCEFEAHRCRSHPLHAILFTPIYAGDRGTGALVAYPDGKQVLVRDQVTEQIWQKIYADLTPDRGTLPLIPSAHQERQLEEVRRRWREGNPDELWVNPDARTYAAYFTSTDQDTTYHLLTGPLSEMTEANWREASAERIAIVDAALYGRFETSIVHLQGFCLQLHPHVEHITAARHIIPAHHVLLWEHEGTEHVCVMQDYIETWHHLEVKQNKAGQVSISVLKDTPLSADAGRRRLEEQKYDLQSRGIPFTDSHGPP